MGYTLNLLPVYCRAKTEKQPITLKFTPKASLKSAIKLKCMLDGTHSSKGKIWKLHTERAPAAQCFQIFTSSCCEATVYPYAALSTISPGGNEQTKYFADAVLSSNKKKAHFKICVHLFVFKCYVMSVTCVHSSVSIGICHHNNSAL